jgi:hypothetical protein
MGLFDVIFNQITSKNPIILYNNKHPNHTLGVKKLIFQRLIKKQNKGEAVSAISHDIFITKITI